MHSIVWQYLPEAVQRRISAAIAAAAARATPDAPLAWLRMEPDGAGEGAGLRLTLWPEGRDEALGRADFHGRWVAWAIGRQQGLTPPADAPRAGAPSAPGRRGPARRS
jgi:hypothetical protein